MLAHLIIGVIVAQFNLSDAQNWLSSQTGGDIPAQPAQMTHGAQQDMDMYNQGMAPQLPSGQLAPSNDWSKSPTNNRPDWSNVKDNQIENQLQNLKNSFNTPFVPANKSPKDLPSDLSTRINEDRQSHFLSLISSGKLNESALPDLVKKGIITREDANMVIQLLDYGRRKQQEDQEKKNQPQQQSQPPQQIPGMFPDMMNPLTPWAPGNVFRSR